jgi:hypothetical protein
MKIDTTKLKTKAAICGAIQDKFPPSEPSPFRKNFSLNGANYALKKMNNKFFINRRVPVKAHQVGTKKGAAGPRSGLRECSTILKEDLLKYAKALGRRLDPKMTKMMICAELKKFLKKSPSPARSPSSAGLSNFERNLNTLVRNRVPSRSPSSAGLSNFERNLNTLVRNRVSSRSPSSAGLSNFERNLVNMLRPTNKTPSPAKSSGRRKKLKKMINVQVESL